MVSTLNVFTGKTVEEAIAYGLDHLGVTKEEVNIEILHEGRKGFLHIGSKEAEVRIERKAEPKPKDLPLQNGKVWVDSGTIHCIDPANDKEKLMVHIPPMILLYKNNELMKDKGTISESDQLKVDFKNEEIETKWKIEILKNRLAAVIKVEPGTKTFYKLRDQKPAREITLEATKTIAPNLTLTPEDIQQKLKSMGISVGIQEDQIEQACKTENKSEFIIAKGENPVEGKNGWLEYLVEINEGKTFKERKDGSIDYREGRDIPSVTAGTTIAIIHDPIEGMDGTSVKGEVIHPKSVLPLNVKAGSGAQIIDHQIKATSVGRPSVQKRGNTAILTVLPKLEHKGDVSLESGNLKFNGDIFISGNVDEHMKIMAAGYIEIRGTVSEAKIKAGQSIIHYSNVISSEIIAGNNNKVIVEKRTELTDILNNLIAIQHDLQQLKHNPSFVNVINKEGIMPVLKVLIKSKYMSFVNKLTNFMKGFDSELEILNADWQNLFKRLQTIFITMDDKMLPVLDNFDQIVENMTHLIELSNMEEIGVIAQMPSALNSNIYSSGDVKIIKQGCYNCSIHAQGSVEINGFIRGGRLFAGQGAKIEEAGSKGGTPTLICVPHDQIITIKNVFSETTIQIGKKVYQFTKDMTNIVARIDVQGDIAIR